MEKINAEKNHFDQVYFLIDVTMYYLVRVGTYLVSNFAYIYAARTKRKKVYTRTLRQLAPLPFPPFPFFPPAQTRKPDRHAGIKASGSLANLLVLSQHSEQA